MKCIILDDYQQVALDLAPWASLSGITVEALDTHISDPGALAARLAGASIVVAMRERTPFDAALLAALPDLKLLITTGMQNSSIDLDAAAANGITVCGTRGWGNPTIEITWALILMTMRRLMPEIENFRAAGPWQSTLGRTLAGKTLGIVGLGRVGGDVARAAPAFGMDVLAYSPSLTNEAARAKGVRKAPSLPALLQEADVVSLHVRLNDATRAMIGAGEFALMKRNAVLINTCRGPVVDEDALLQALKTGVIAGAGLDVYSVEPLAPDHPFRTLPNVLCTPHLGYVTRENYERHYADAIDDIAAWLDGRPVRVLN